MLNAVLRSFGSIPVRAPRGADAMLHALRAGVPATVLAVAFPLAVWAQDAAPAQRTVFLELFTSQGCASCPPADDFMHQLATRDDVIALSLHVDYWDYIGWVDTLADPEHAERQKRYARRHGQSTIYTPQMVINGIDFVEGFRTAEVDDAIAMHHARTPEVEIALQRTEAGALEILATPLQEFAPALAMASRRSAMPGVSAILRPRPMSEAGAADLAPVARGLVENGDYIVELIRYVPEVTVAINAGENAGRSAIYNNVVTSWRTLGAWDLQAPLAMTVALDGSDPIVVLIQERGQGEVIAAARLR